MSNQIQVGSNVVAIKNAPDHDVVKGDKLIVSEIRTDLVYVHAKYSSLYCCIPIDCVVHEHEYNNPELYAKIESANKAVEYARASAQGALNEFLPILEDAKQFIEGKTHSNACSLHKKFVDLLSSMHFLECELEHLSTLKE
jgi:hypothetical protein